ncbi:SGNH/GDSL hydrolase family protein [Massilia sp. W12]|uniref:SGNH/GDSL hydrolase family protein n=1 Tax=Massilia sp. W12 TaxID=3126507 RepID=UPI0030CD525B
MRHIKFALSLLAAAALTACGGGGGAGDQTPKMKFSAQVSFGDSLSDVGTYAVGTVAALKGGKYNINGATSDVLTGKNWTELMAAQLGLPAPCPAMTGLDGDAAKGFSVPVTNNANCFGYAQGGARVTNPVGPGHKMTGSALGQLTVPVVTQVANHLAKVGGSFKGDEMVFVMAGGNDALIGLAELSKGAEAAGAAEGARVGAATFAQSLVTDLAAGATNPQTAAQAIGLALATENARSGHTDQTVVAAAVQAAASQPGNQAVGSPAVYGPMVASAQAKATAAGKTAGEKAGKDYFTANAPLKVAAMAQAGAELVALVKNQIIAKGAKYVAVVNLPDLATTPGGRARGAEVSALIDTMVKAFNSQLSAGLSGDARIALVDAYTVSHDEFVNKDIYGLTNVMETACDLSEAKNPFGSSLICNASNVKSGDISHYQFADDVHPTPYGYWLLARYVSRDLAMKGWL